MGKSFDKNLMLANIYYLIKEQGRKIGEVENDAGMSSGYLSRVSKDQFTKPGIDFIFNVANILKVSIDTLVGVDLTALTPTEEYLLRFMEKLRDDTTSDKLDWKRESSESLNRLQSDENGEVGHPLFSLETFEDFGQYEVPERITEVVFVSHTFDCYTFIDGDCYSLRLKNGSHIHLMHIAKRRYSSGDPNAHAIEMWMTGDNGKQYLCSNIENTPLSKLLTGLYTVVSDYSKHPKVMKELRYVIDAFMKDDLEDDPIDPDELPF